MATTNARLTMIAVASIVPNAYNPNRMSKAAFAEYVAEVRRLGRLPKPIVVRPTGNGNYEAVDGAHGHAAACEAGLTEVLCEVIEADDFEAMRQTYKRNRGGKNQPVLLGRMFREMMKAGELSARKLAKDVNVSEGTIRNMLAYAKAADLRAEYAGEDRSLEVSQLKTRQVEMYLRLPPEMRDVWLDAGGFIEHPRATCWSNGWLNSISPNFTFSPHWFLPAKRPTTPVGAGWLPLAVAKQCRKT